MFLPVTLPLQTAKNRIQQSYVIITKITKRKDTVHCKKRNEEIVQKELKEIGEQSSFSLPNF